MALTQISTAGVKDDAVTSGKIPANAVGSSELADNAVDTAAIADQAVALSKLPHGDGSSDGKFLRANNGADPTFETIAQPDLTQLSATNLTSGTVPDARFPATLPAASGANLTNLPPNRVNRNLIINGASTVSQRYGTTSTSISSSAPQYVVDRFLVQTNIGSSHSHQQVADAPTGFYYSQKVTSGTGGSNVGTAFGRYRTTLEWQDVIPQSGFGTSGAKQLVLSFYVKSSLTGTFGVAVQSSTNTRNIVNTYTINSANTWERKTVVIAADTNNAWVASTAVHLEIGWDLGEGTGRGTGTLNTWGAGLSGYGYNSGVKFFTQSSATWQITGVQLEVDHTGSGVATDFEHRSFGQELTLCQRYFEIAEGGFQGAVYGTDSDMKVSVPFKVTKRANPTLASISNNENCCSSVSVTANSFDQTLGAKVQGNNVFLDGANRFFNVKFSASAEL